MIRDAEVCRQKLVSRPVVIFCCSNQSVISSVTSKRPLPPVATTIVLTAWRIDAPATADRLLPLPLSPHAPQIVQSNRPATVLPILVKFDNYCVSRTVAFLKNR